MDELVELVELVNKQKVKNIEVIGNNGSKSSKLNRLYDGISSGNYCNDEDAAKDLYGSGSDNPSYKKLKSRLEKRLLNTVPFVDLNRPRFTDATRAYYSNQKIIHIINILIGLGSRLMAMSLARKNIATAIKFEQTEVILELSKILIAHYGTRVGDFKKLKYYSAINQKYLAVYTAESLANRYYAELAFYNTNTSERPKDFEEKAIAYQKELTPYLVEVQTYTFLINSYTVFWLRYAMLNDFRGGLKICEELILKVGSMPKVSNTIFFVFYSRMIICHIQLNNFKEGELSFQKAVEFSTEGNFNWFNLHRNYALLCFGAKKYQHTVIVLKTVQQHKNYEKLKGILKELWRINEAYINFLFKIGKIKLEEGDNSLGEFRINKFVNEVPVFSMDKRGVNIPILIIQFLFLLQQRKYGEVIDKSESLNAYCYRYLKKNNTFRSNCFIRLLLLLPKCDFNRTAVERKSTTLLEKLKSVPLEVANQAADVEIIPYEDLWEIVLGMLDKKSHKTRVR